MPLFGEIKRTYSKKQVPVQSLRLFDENGKENRNKINLNGSLDESIWKDSFDKLLNDKSILREKQVIKKKVNANYNRDSSKEYSDLSEIFCSKPKRKKAPKVQEITKDPVKPRPNRKRKKKTHQVIGDAVISTPVGGKKAKQTNNLSFNLSPIGFGNGPPLVSLNDSSYLRSLPKFPMLPNTVNGEPRVRKFFNFHPVAGERRVDVNLEHESVKEMMKSFVKAVNEKSLVLNGKSIIEISHTDDEIIDEVVHKTNPDTLIRLALLPRDILTEVLEKSLTFETRHSLETHVTHRKGSKSYKNSDEFKQPDSPDFRGFSDSSIGNYGAHEILEKSPQIDFVTTRKTKSSDKEILLPDFYSSIKRETNYQSHTSIPSASKSILEPIFVPDSPKNIRNDVTQGVPGRENYGEKSILEPIFVPDSPKNMRNDVTQRERENCTEKSILEPFFVPDSPKNIRNDVTQGVPSDISVIPATPIKITTRRPRRKTSGNSCNPPTTIPTIPDNVSVIDCTFAEKADQRRVTRRMTKKVVQFIETRVSMEPEEPKILVAPSQEEAPVLQLAPGKWRKSFAAWKRKTLAFNGTNVNETTGNSTRSSKVGVRKSDGKWLSSVGRQTIQEDDEDEELVLEPTTDETCNFSELSLRDSEEDSDQEEKTRSILCREQSNNKTSNELQRSHSYIDESRRHRSLYRRQLSTLVRKTSVYERRLVSPSSASYYNSLGDPTNDLLLILPKLTARDVVLRLCKQSEPLAFDEIYSAQALHCCRKIGEGVYSEVFMHRTTQGRTIVLKIIPVEGDQLVNGEPQKRFDEIQSEIVIAQELTNLRYGTGTDKYMTNGFVEAVNVRCVQGRYPDHLIDLWELYDENRTSDNDHPELFKDDQLFIVLELANGGQDLEAFHFDNAQQSHSAFVQVAITLAIAEKRLEFEHRDLHWGNVLLSNTDESHVTFKIDGKSIEVPTYGVKATIIDFTLSRMVANGVRLYNDLAQDDELFTASGDYQFDIYRFMKSRLDNCWERFEPYTNLLWLHYLVDKMINGARYKNSKSKKHRAAVDQLMQLRDELLDYKSAADYVECIHA